MLVAMVSMVAVMTALALMMARFRMMKGPFTSDLTHHGGGRHKSQSQPLAGYVGPFCARITSTVEAEAEEFDDQHHHHASRFWPPVLW